MTITSDASKTGWGMHAEHISGKANVAADRESRRRFEAMDIDLFAARHNAQLPRYYSYRPDPYAEAVDAMTQNWSQMKPYAFPPFIVIGRCLHKVKQDKVERLVL